MHFVDFLCILAKTFGKTECKKYVYIKKIALVKINFTVFLGARKGITERYPFSIL